jgi:hypothetical protein
MIMADSRVVREDQARIRRISKRYRVDAGFRARMDSDPYAAMSEETPKSYMDTLFPEQKLAIHVDVPGVQNFVLPLDPNRELRQDEMAAKSSSGAAEGVSTVSSAGTVATASTALSCFGCASSNGCVGTASSS